VLICSVFLRKRYVVYVEFIIVINHPKTVTVLVFFYFFFQGNTLETLSVYPVFSSVYIRPLIPGNWTKRVNSQQCAAAHAGLF